MRKHCAKLGLCILLTCILLLLIYTSLVLPNSIIAIEKPCSPSWPGVIRYSDRSRRKAENEAAKIKGIAEPERQVVANKKGAENEEAILAIKDKRIAELEQKLREVKVVVDKNDGQVITDETEFDFPPLRVTVAHHPRIDMLGSFTLPTVFLLAVTYHWGWEMEILPYEDSRGELHLKGAYAKGPAMGKGWGTGLQDANHRRDFQPWELNAQVYANLGFFSDHLYSTANISEWTEVWPLPAPGQPALREACMKNAIKDNGVVRCRLILPFNSDTGPLQKHILANGDINDFFPASLRELMRKHYMEKNRHRIKYFSNSSDYNVAIHVRRGDVSIKHFPDRWTEQSSFAAVARHICEKHPTADIHVFSSGRIDEGWATLEQVKDTCGSVTIHLDGFEFDVWAHLVAADALVVSKSTFGYVPALISGGDIYTPPYGHRPLAHWHIFQNEDGKIIK